jgi:hypothetical protein
LVPIEFCRFQSHTAKFWNRIVSEALADSNLKGVPATIHSDWNIEA